MSTDKNVLLKVTDLAVDFRQGETVTHAVNGVSFEVKRGETLALVGESGSGKSVTALSILKLLPYPAAHHPSGSVVFKGEELLDSDESDLRRVRGNDITMIFQEPMTSLNPLHTIERQIAKYWKSIRACAKPRRASALWNCLQKSVFATPKAGSAPTRTNCQAASASA